MICIQLLLISTNINSFLIYDGPIKLDEVEVVIYEDAERGIRKTRIDYLLPNFIKVISEEKERVSGRKQHWAEGVVVRLKMEHHLD